MSRNNYIRVFEHAALRMNEVVDGVTFEPHHLEALQAYHGEKGCAYFSLIHRGVKFNQHVGVLQVGALTIEVLPKADRAETDKAIWHSFLIHMLRSVGFLDVHQTGQASLRLKSNSILEIYMELFLKEVQYLVRTGLVKKYRKKEGNNFALKGSLLFTRHIQQNLVHAERFYVRHSTYDRDNLFNQILYKALQLVRQLNSSAYLSADIESLLLDFPECKDLVVSHALFERLAYDRKTEAYRKAIGIARLLLLNYHPDIWKGSSDVLALMFDMNSLWEAYVFKALKKALAGKFIVRGQVPSGFWQPAKGRLVKIYPDLVVYTLDGKVVAILDTKWKNISGSRPSDDDLKQMFVYNLNFACQHSALLYPGTNQENASGDFSMAHFGGCCLLFLPLERRDDAIRLNLERLESFIWKTAEQSET